MRKLINNSAVPSTCRLQAFYDDYNNCWFVGYRYYSPKIIVIEDAMSEADAKDYVDRYYKRDAQASEHGISLP